MIIIINDYKLQINIHILLCIYSKVLANIHLYIYVMNVSFLWTIKSNFVVSIFVLFSFSLIQNHTRSHNRFIVFFVNEKKNFWRQTPLSTHTLLRAHWDSSGCNVMYWLIVQEDLMIRSWAGTWLWRCWPEKDYLIELIDHEEENGGLPNDPHFAESMARFIWKPTKFFPIYICASKVDLYIFFI